MNSNERPRRSSCSSAEGALAGRQPPEVDSSASSDDHRHDDRHRRTPMSAPATPRTLRKVQRAAGTGDTGNWRSKRVDREVFIDLLSQGLPHVDIARRLGVTGPLIARLIRQLSHRDLVAVTMARPVAYVPPVKVSMLTPVDVIGEVMGVLDELRHIRGFLASAEGAATFRNPSTRLSHQLQVLDRILRWAESFMALRKQMTEWSGFEAWRNEMLAMLEEESPELKERLIRRITARVLVERKPKPVEQPEPRRPPLIDPEQVPPGLRSYAEQMNARGGVQDHGQAAATLTG